MDKIIVKSHAKINLFLHVLDNYSYDGYYSLETIIAFLDFYDIIELKVSKDNINHTCFSKNSILLDEAGINLPSSEQNLVTKVLQYFSTTYNTPYFSAEITKHIPLGSGLGGGSSNAASAILAINDLCQLKLSTEKLIEIASLFGSDVPCFIKEKSCFVFGRGEKIITLDKQLPTSIPAIIIYPYIHIHTCNIFQNLKLNQFTPHLDINWKEINYSIDDLMKILIIFTKNDLVKTAKNIYPILNSVENLLEQTQPLLSRMTGSGSSFFALYKNKLDQDKAYNYLLQRAKHKFFIKKVMVSI